MGAISLDLNVEPGLNRVVAGQRAANPVHSSIFKRHCRQRATTDRPTDRPNERALYYRFNRGDGRQQTHGTRRLNAEVHDPTLTADICQSGPTADMD